jgi:glycosyltransferase involved in cell wall biosynthesis
VGTIVHFDNPISPEELVASYRAGRGERSDQRRAVARQTVERVLHRRDEPGIYRRTFIFGGRRSRLLGRPRRDAYVDYVTATLAAHGLGTRPIVVWAYPSNEDLPALIDAIAPAVVVADVVDDNRSWYEPGTVFHDRIESNYASVLDRSDVVLANCQPVADAMARFAPDVQVVPNGLELPTDLPAAPLASSLPSALRGSTRPLIAYVGNLSSRLDLPLIEAVARARPQWNIALVGSAHLDRSALELGRLPNVFLLGVMPYAEVRRFLAHVDVGLIPHLDNEMTRSMNPLKAFVYASAGVPVVSTPVANLPDFGDLITVATGADGFVAAIEAHLAAGRGRVDIDVLRPHSWTQRVDRVFELIDGAVDASRPT